ncbi:MAG: hypothetical protein ACJAZ2_001268, partial [Glaciecola sp.]
AFTAPNLGITDKASRLIVSDFKPIYYLYCNNTNNKI